MYNKNKLRINIVWSRAGALQAMVYLDDTLSPDTKPMYTTKLSHSKEQLTSECMEWCKLKLPAYTVTVVSA